MAVAALLAGCGPPGGDGPPTPSPASPEEAWVRLYDPARAANGYNLVLFHARRPTLLDMNGRVVHAWPEARVKSRVRLLPDGHLLGIALGPALVEYDWQGREVWRYPVRGGIPHHDFRRLPDGNTLVLVRPDDDRTDVVLEVDRAGRTLWRWRSGDHLGPWLDRGRPGRPDLTHINSIQPLPDNPLFRRGDRRFRPGNLLMSARNLNLVFVVDRGSGEVVWTWGERLDLQHEALMLGDGDPAAGSILLFDNGYRNRWRHRRSQLVVLDPASREVTWRWDAPGFYSPTAGLAQPLPGGNLLVASSRGGRVFEITRDGEAVWEWTPPFDPVRPSRVAYDHTPQLAALRRPAERPVAPAAGTRHVDPDVYRFARRGALRKVRLGGEERRVLREPAACRRLILPTAAVVRLVTGLAAARAPRSGARFVARIEVDGEAAVELVRSERTPERGDGGGGGGWRERIVDLSRWQHRDVELCVEVSPRAPGGPPLRRWAFWANPVVRPGEAVPQASVEPPADDLTDAEREARRRHLEALGYVD